MRLAIFSHCAVDAITIGSDRYDQIGGSACYCSIMARQFKFDVDLHTRFGADFPSQYLAENGIDTTGCESGSCTTRFAIAVDGSDRTLVLEHQCEPVPYAKADADGHMVSPIFQEISGDVLESIKGDSRFLLVDPQGFLRRTDPQNRIVLERTDLDLSGVDAIKVSPGEAKCLADGTGTEMMKAIQKMGVKYVLLTDKTNVSLLVGDKVYSITIPSKRIHDTTGIGDIFGTAFCCTMLKEKDFLWALCFAGGAVQAALDSKNVGLQKIPRRGAVQTNASYFYNMVKFRDL